ncbi:hypothetical protein EV363DRAFT_1313358 [Boletus edulis]|nr:hypothetical protein EV363DRAFT_1313358 [Boletus edulis]
MRYHRAGGSLSDQIRQHRALEAARPSSTRSAVQEDEAEMLPSPPDYNPLIRGSTSMCRNLTLSLGPYDKPRRILHGHNFTYVVTAHGTIDQVSTSALKFDRNLRSSSSPFQEFVDDACMPSHQGDPIIILGHAREQNQIAFLSLDHGQVSRHVTLHRDWNTAKKPGVSAMTSLMSPLKFASGGYDHRVHLWDIAQDLSGASGVELAIKHTSLIHSLLPVMDTSHKLVSVGADCDVPIYDMSAERVEQILKTSCTPYHAHNIDSRSCTLLEVSHLETQFEVRDHRILNQAVQRFGFLVEEKRGRFEKAESWSHFVACGDRSGAVHLWDLRNVSTEVGLRQCFNDPVIQVVHTGPRLLACSRRNELACINFLGE